MDTTEPRLELLVEPTLSDWKCFMFGAKDDFGIAYTPRKGDEPN